MTELTDLSETDASNTTITSANIAEGCAPSGINNAIRNTLGLIRRAFKTSIFRLRDSTDQTKLLALDLSGLTTATTRTLAVPDRDGTVGVPTVAPELGTTSGTSKSFTIPATAKQVTFTFYGVSTNGSSIVMLRLGDSGGVETTGYVGCSTQLFATTTGFSTDAYTSGFGIRIANAATAVLSGSVIFTRSHASDNVWIAHGVVADTANIGTCTIAGSKLLSGALTEVQLTTANGTDAFDAGAVDVYYS